MPYLFFRLLTFDRSPQNVCNSLQQVAFLSDEWSFIFFGSFFEVINFYGSDLLALTNDDLTVLGSRRFSEVCRAVNTITQNNATGRNFRELICFGNNRRALLKYFFQGQVTSLDDFRNRVKAVKFL